MNVSGANWKVCYEHLLGQPQGTKGEGRGTSGGGKGVLQGQEEASMAGAQGDKVEQGNSRA